MSRVKRGPKRAQRRKKILKQAKGYYGAKSKAHRVAKLAVEKSLTYAYRDRRQRKRQFRRLWIVRINAAARLNGLTYARFMAGIKAAEVDLNRKMLSEIAIHDPAGFTTLANAAKEALGLPIDEPVEVVEEAPAPKAKKTKPKKEAPAEPAAEEPAAEEPKAEEPAAEASDEAPEAAAEEAEASEEAPAEPEASEEEAPADDAEASDDSEESEEKT